MRQFVSRKALDIDAIGSIVAEKLVERGLIQSPLDIFEIDEGTLATLNLGTEENPRIFGEKNAAKILQALERAKKEMPLARWLFAMGISQVGESVAREVSRLHQSVGEIQGSVILRKLEERGEMDTWVKKHPASPKYEEITEEEKQTRKAKAKPFRERIRDLSKELRPFEISEELGGVAANSILSFFKSAAGERVLTKMERLGIDPQSDNYAPNPREIGGADGKVLSGKTFVITGSLSVPREEIAARILGAGGRVSGGVSKNTDFLLAGEGGGSKHDKANLLGIKVISEADLESFLTL